MGEAYTTFSKYPQSFTVFCYNLELLTKMNYEEAYKFIDEIKYGG